MDKDLFRQVMGRFATGVTVVTTTVGEQIHGMAANAFMAGSLEPPLCVVSISRTARMHEQLSVSRRFGISILSQEQHHLSNHFAGRPLPGMQPEFMHRAGMPVIHNSIAVLVAKIIDLYECGDHTLFIGQIEFMELGRSTAPIVFFSSGYARIATGEPIEDFAPPAFW